MQDSILSRLEASRKELLDLGLRNPLLNYKLPAGRGLHIVQEKASSIFDILVNGGKAMSFAGRAVQKEEGTAIIFEEPSGAGPEASFTDTKLQTAENEVTLQHKLLNTYYAARTSIEEQGINILYIALGMLHWYESDSSGEERLAPLVLVPVTLERSSARERFRVSYNLEEIGSNLSLQAKMKSEFGISIPPMPEEEEFDIEAYFEKIAGAIPAPSRWRVEKDAVELGFFSFGKFMMYHDLDNARWPDSAKPVNHALLQNLFGAGFADGQPSVSETTFIDTETNADELYQVVDADSSQVGALLAVNEGRNLVIQGPPGTGKSQTITNIIANAIGQGKKVLFVAEKMAALEVVKRRLDNINLGEACLELHSHKANKKELHQELRRVLELGKPAIYQLQQEVALLGTYKEALNAYCLAVNTEVGRSSLSVQRIMGYLLELYKGTAGVELPKIHLPDMEQWDAVRMKRAEAFAERIQRWLKEMGIPSKLLFWGSELTELLPHEQQTTGTLLKEAKEGVESLQDEAKKIALHLNVPLPLWREESVRLLAVCHLAGTTPNLDDTDLKNGAWLRSKEDIRELLHRGKELSRLQEAYRDIFIPEAWEEDVLPIKEVLIAHGEKWYKFLISAYNKSNNRLAALCRVKLTKDNGQKLTYIDDILTAKRLTTLLKEKEVLAGELFGKGWRSETKDWESLAAVADYLAVVHQQIREGTCPEELLHYLSKNESPEVARQYEANLSKALSTHEQGIGAVTEKILFNEVKRFPGSSLLVQPFSQQTALLTDWYQRLPELFQAVSWNNLVEAAAEEHLQSLTGAAIHWEEAGNGLKAALQKTWYEFLLEQASLTYPALRKFDYTGHEEAVRQFQRLDKLNLQFNRAKIALKHWEGVPRLEAGEQVNVLRTEFNKKARHKPIRKLIQEAGHAVQAIKPVFMMSPLSIANFLTPGALQFDLVVFDEASQVRPVDAIGALLRGKQLVVVGDTKQLPPTSFFDSLTGDTEDEENVTADIQSILGMCDAQGAPRKMLRWHYRSRHQSLISLSNHEFYEDKLVIFPSPGSPYRMGLFFQQLKDTVYDRGNSRTNPLEAEAVAAAVMEHARKYPKLSLGVVAFSSAQRGAIQDALELKRRSYPEGEPWFKSHPVEPFFIKNLENVQGDERDVIFISIGYGRTREGYVSLSFGPLNNEGGEKRLNVLITRAKLRCEVFTNITSDDIDINKTKSTGVRALKSFLYFAEHGTLGLSAETGRLADSPFEDSVAKDLTRLGYIVRKQIGSPGCYIDLAIVDPQNGGRYLLGLECDGAAYHAARSARDRDRLRQQVLEGIGWRMHRVWSTDWFRNPERELKRVTDAIEKAAAEASVDDDAEEEASLVSIAREMKEEATVSTIDYTHAVLPAEMATQEIHLHPVGKLATWLEAVVKVESPVHFEEVVRRMVDAAGMARVGPRIREHLKLALRFAVGGGKIKQRDEFLWEVQMEKPLLRNRSKFSGASRKIKYIAPEEICLALEEVVRNAVAIEAEAAVPYIARMFGFSRVTEDMKKEILEVIQTGVEQHIVKREGELLTLTAP